MGKIRWTEKASSHLRAIHDYISRDSTTYATRFITTLINRTSKLKTFPYCGRIVPELEGNDLREVIFQNYRIVYRVISETNDIEILAVIHAARDMKNIAWEEWEI